MDIDFAQSLLWLYLLLENIDDRLLVRNQQTTLQHRRVP